MPPHPDAALLGVGVIMIKLERSLACPTTSFVLGAVLAGLVVLITTWTNAPNVSAASMSVTNRDMTAASFETTEIALPRLYAGDAAGRRYSLLMASPATSWWRQGKTIGHEANTVSEGPLSSLQSLQPAFAWMMQLVRNPRSVEAIQARLVQGYSVLQVELTARFAAIFEALFPGLFQVTG